jgi:hypothetical protein
MRIGKSELAGALGEAGNRKIRKRLASVLASFLYSI